MDQKTFPDAPPIGSIWEILEEYVQTPWGAQFNWIQSGDKVFVNEIGQKPGHDPYIQVLFCTPKICFGTRIVGHLFYLKEFTQYCRECENNLNLQA